MQRMLCCLLAFALLSANALGLLHRLAHPQGGGLHAAQQFVAHQNLHSGAQDHHDEEHHNHAQESTAHGTLGALFGHEQSHDCVEYDGLVSAAQHCSFAAENVPFQPVNSTPAAQPQTAFCAAPQSRAHSRDPPEIA